jgi:hypothetical protein
VATKLTCPDCGGLLGPPEPGVSSCTCFKDDAFSEPGFSEPSVERSLSDTHPVETLSKLCFRCGADVAGKKRYKDSRGYMCAECNKAEIAAEKAGTAQCGECGRRVKEASLTDYRGTRTCKLCMVAVRDAEKKKIKVVSGKNFEAQDRRSLKMLVVIMILLAIVIIYSHFKPS